LSWSIRRAIETLDEAIDRMGDQLARSAGLYADSPTTRASARTRTEYGVVGEVILSMPTARRSIRSLTATDPTLLDLEIWFPPPADTTEAETRRSVSARVWSDWLSRQ
jgi:hypothetical protein